MHAIIEQNERVRLLRSAVSPFLMDKLHTNEFCEWLCSHIEDTKCEDVEIDWFSSTSIQHTTHWTACTHFEAREYNAFELNTILTSNRLFNKFTYCLGCAAPFPPYSGLDGCLVCDRGWVFAFAAHLNKTIFACVRAYNSVRCKATHVKHCVSCAYIVSRQAPSVQFEQPKLLDRLVL